MNNIPTITRNLLLINIICFLVQQVLQLRGINVTDWLGLHFVLASQFNVLQLISYMFLHGSWTHLFFNMFSLWMFGRIIETTLGAKRYLYGLRHWSRSMPRIVANGRLLYPQSLRLRNGRHRERSTHAHEPIPQ